MSIRNGLIGGAILVLGLCAAGAAAQADEDYGPLKVMETTAGKVLTDPNGMTLYTFDKDNAGESACYDTCAENWPPALAPADAQPVGDLTLVKRKDGSLQWADDGKPLYTFINDKKPGDVTGDGKNDVWHAVMEE
jgi:predicted lipoprotein with Yx(FWY)xxD motif